MKESEEIDKLISEGLTEQAINLLEGALNKKNPYYDEFIMVKARFNQLKKKERIGVVDAEDSTIEVNSINFSIISLAKKAFRAREQEITTGSSKFSKLILVSFATLILAGLIYFSITILSDPAPSPDPRLVKVAYGELDESIKNLFWPFVILYENTCFDQNYRFGERCDTQRFSDDFNYAFSELKSDRFLSRLDSIDFFGTPKYPDLYPNALWWEFFWENASRNETKINALWNKNKDYYSNDTKLKINQLLDSEFFKIRLLDLKTLAEANDHLENFYISWMFINGPDGGKEYFDFLTKLKDLREDIKKNTGH